MEPLEAAVPLRTIAREWGRIGCIGFGAPGPHFPSAQALCTGQALDSRRRVRRRHCGNQPPARSRFDPTSHFLRLAPPLGGALVGGACFIVPGWSCLVALAAVFLARHRPLWVSGAAADSVPLLLLWPSTPASSLVPSSWKRAGQLSWSRARWGRSCRCGRGFGGAGRPLPGARAYGCRAGRSGLALPGGTGDTPGGTSPWAGSLASLLAVAAPVGGLAALVWRPSRSAPSPTEGAS